MSLSFNPNLSCVLPVEILELVFASIFGFNLRPISIFFFRFLAIFSMLFSSLSDSTFIRKIFFLIANFNSWNFFPTPEYTILLGLNPMDSAFFNSPSETTSAPRPLFLIIFSMDEL